MPLDPSIDYEHLPPGDAMDETDINLRTHFSRMSDEKLAKYSSNLTNEEVMEWDGDFKDDGSLMLTCSERDVMIDEYRAVLEVHIQHRNLP